MRRIPLLSRLRRKVATFAAMSGTLLCASSKALAGPSDITVRMHCPVLSDIAASEFEARAKVDLSSRIPRGGELEVDCDGLAAKIRWRTAGQVWLASSVPPTATSAAFVDALLVASKELVERNVRDANRGKDAKAEGEQPAPSATEVPESLSTEPESEPKGEQARQAERPRRLAKVVPMAPPSPEKPNAASAGKPGTWAVGVLAGTQAALYSASGAGIAGPKVGAYFDWGGWLTASLSGAYDYGIGAGDIASVRLANAIALFAARLGPDRVFELGAGGYAGLVFVSAPSPYQPTSQSQYSWGALVSARYAPRLSAWRLAIGPDLRIQGLRPDVAVDGVQVWRVPEVSAGFTFELGRELYSSTR